jgi:hypothetical protein
MKSISSEWTSAEAQMDGNIHVISCDCIIVYDYVMIFRLMFRPFTKRGQVATLEEGGNECGEVAKVTNVGKTMINHHIFDGLYHPFMVILGMVYYGFNHIIVLESYFLL